MSFEEAERALGAHPRVRRCVVVDTQCVEHPHGLALVELSGAWTVEPDELLVWLAERRAPALSALFIVDSLCDPAPLVRLAQEAMSGR